MSYTIATNMGSSQEWYKTLDFYQTELGILEERLAEITGKNTNAEVMASAEHFQNQFIIQRNNIIELKHKIAAHDHLAFKDAKEHVGRVEEDRVTEHKEIEEELVGFEKLLNDVRQEFNRYVAKWI